MTDDDVHRFLIDAEHEIQDQSRQLLVRQIYKTVFQKSFPGLSRQSSGPIINTAERACGEGSHHAELKNWIAQNPSALGLPKNSISRVEHCFESGDRVDLLFDLPGGDQAVVEIEVDDCYPGAHQAVKYKVLAAVRRQLPIASSKVQAALVAWRIKPRTAKFCKKYGIAAWECKPGGSARRIA